MLSATIDAKPSQPEWVVPAFLLRRANYRALSGDAGAADDVARVLGEARWKDRHKAADGLLKWMTARRASGEAAIYASLLRGNRLAAERSWDEAAAAYEPVRRDHPDDPQVRYRIAALQFARGDAAGAAPALSGLAADRKAPAWIRAHALLLVARGTTPAAAGRGEAESPADRKDYEHENAAGRRGAWPAPTAVDTAPGRLSGLGAV